MNLIGRYSNPGYASVADAVREFFERRVDLQRPGVAFGPEAEGEPAAEAERDPASETEGANLQT